ncbi:Adhesion and hyphal regulator 1 [Apiospora saccharicola]|uniref:Adhesion and hyphal regulator 1 n=1 Tax=Apiospora saccharicola TaxID=335842 RepID=A0ABR1TH48_9PEZI
MDRRDSSTRSLEPDGSQPSSKPKRMRKSRSRGLRTRTGCKSENIAEFMCDSLTCRARHKKCDENRMLSTEPRCLNWS